MIFDPHASRQSKITTQILISHAMERCPLQKTLALELETTDSRISEWKSGKGYMATDTAQVLIEKFGSPAKAKGVFKSNCKFLPPELPLQSFFNELVCCQVSRLIAGYLTHIRCIVIPDRSNNLEASIEDNIISKLLEDIEFLMISKSLFDEHNSKERHWTETDEFQIGNSNIDFIHSIQGSNISILSLLERYELQYLLKEKKYEYLSSTKRPTPNELIAMLMYVSIVINDLRMMPTTILSTWLGHSCYLNIPEPMGGEVVLTGDLIHEWYDNKFTGDPVFATSETDPIGQAQLLLKHMMQLRVWVNKFEKSMEHSLFSRMIEQTPLYHSNEKCKEALILVKEIQVFHKEECSYLNIAITVCPHSLISDAYKDKEFTIIMEKVTTSRLLEEVIPMLHAIGLKHTISELKTKYQLAKHGLLIPGVISI